MKLFTVRVLNQKNSTGFYFKIHAIRLFSLFFGIFFSKILTEVAEHEISQ